MSNTACGWLPPFARRLLLLALLLPAATTTSAAGGIDPLDRVQLHRNPNRSVPYLTLGQAGESAGSPMLTMRPLLKIELDGDPLQNVYGNLRPIDVDGDGDGAYEFVHFNGFRYMQVWDATGRKLWRVEDPDGRLHNYQTGTHRDTISVLDLDGDGRQDIAHCWLEGGQRALVFRRGSDGAVIRSLPLEGGVDRDCQMGVFRMAATRQPILLLAHPIAGTAKARCPRNFTDTWARTVAFDLDLRKLWERNTCDAGHYAWPLDEDQDGWAEAVFVGKYLLRADGSLQCKLAGWPVDDHADGLSIADLDPVRPGLEAVAVGRTGVALFRAATCQEVWRIPATVIRNPQNVSLARLDPNLATPQIVIDEKGTEEGSRTFVVSGQGHVVAARTNGAMPIQNANLDGARGVDEMVGGFGAVTDILGNTRLTRFWYWWLRGTKVTETNAGPYPTSYDRWQAFPLVFDFDRDGRDEIVTWGQSLIVVGKVSPPAAAVTRSARRQP
jgi:hypothetical protein